MIAIIEDDRGWEEYYHQILADYDLKCFHDGLAAVQWMDETVPELVILDILLTGPTRVDVLNVMDSHPELAKVPVVNGSSVAMPQKELVKYGVRAVFDKGSMLPQDLLKSVQAALDEVRNGK